ncbi:GNAT family N-acetyltransferase [Niabella yanshanensis]|uniref:GNAT family N-acetyltransferase n=1 Tax=Niabella yanshanensis TaxID=577386 RepID=A0ABZ0W8W4_9BACT|nr:GNAT family N-acetyltransferase [Niabella yanshanensis]WQD39636.1 GNAT family N-acetyltransferase [Niabella yanshanensis]
MQKGTRSDKALIVDILTKAFNDNKSVNYIIQQDKRRMERIRELGNYSCEMCLRFGEIFISEDQTACALILFPDRKRTTAGSVVCDLRLIIKAMGLSNLPRALKRNKAISKVHPPGFLYHIWYIGVEPQQQGKGTGSLLLRELIARARRLNRKPVLETSTKQNVPWYQKHGFTIYRQLNFGFDFYCMKL